MTLSPSRSSSIRRSSGRGCRAGARVRTAALALLVAGCATLSAPSTEPPPGAVTAEPGFPPHDRTWLMRTVDHKGVVVETTRWITIGLGAYEGRSVYRMVAGSQVVVYD